MEIEEALIRTHGFERPFHPLQVLSWIVFGLDFCIFAVLELPLLTTTAARVGVGLTFGCSVVVLIWSTVVATLRNTADPHLAAPRECTDMEILPYCSICTVPVLNRSKHCRTCNKCVDVFDHHCMWLNTCIGKANYRAFAVVICSAAVMIGIVLGTCVYLLREFHVNSDDFAERLHGVAYFDHAGGGEMALGILVTMTLLNLPLLFLDMQLVILHAFLAWQNLTTYEYITSKWQLQLDGDPRQLQLDEHRPAKEEAVSKDRGSLVKRVYVLPTCLDWIVFARCGRRRRHRRPPERKAVEGFVADGSKAFATSVVPSTPAWDDSVKFKAEPLCDSTAPDESCSTLPSPSRSCEENPHGCAAGKDERCCHTPSPPGTCADEEVDDESEPSLDGGSSRTAADDGAEDTTFSEFTARSDRNVADLPAAPAAEVSESLV